jgi:hypothetical protein
VVIAIASLPDHGHTVVQMVITDVCIDMQHNGGELLLTVTDNGVGVDEDSIYREGSHGLMGIRERAFMLGGSLDIGDSPRGGGRLTVRLPLQARARTEDIVHEARRRHVAVAAPGTSHEPIRIARPAGAAQALPRCLRSTAGAFQPGRARAAASSASMTCWSSTCGKFA